MGGVSTPPPAPTAPARAPRGGRRFGLGDLLRSMMVVLAFVLAVFWLTPRPTPDPVRPIDHVGAWEQAAAAADYPVYAPEGLPDGWRATSARPARASDGSPTWHLGLVTPTTRYAGVEQGAGEPMQFLSRVAPGRDSDPVTVAGVPWQRRVETGGDDRTLWRTEGGSTVVVTGTAEWPELEQLAATLRPR